MNLDGCKLIAHDSDHWHIARPDGRPMRIARKALDPDTATMIDQHFACGGEVKGYDQGGMVEEDPTMPRTEYEIANGMPAGGGSALGTVPQLIDTLRAPQPQAHAPGMGDVRTAESALAQETPIAPPSSVLSMADAGAPLAPMPQSKTAPIAAPTAALPNAPAALARGEKEQRAGIVAEGQAQKQGYADQATEQARTAERLGAIDAETNRIMGERQAGAAQKIADYEATPIKADRAWATRGLSGQIQGAIAIILGGIGAGLTRGPNYALEIINRLTDEDIDAQKAELGKKHNALAAYMAETKNIEAARRYVRADALDRASFQIQAAASKMNSDVAQAAAQKAAGALTQAAAQARQEAVAREVHTRAEAQTTKLQADQFAAQNAAQNLMAKVGAGLTGGADLPPGATELLPEKMQQRLVPIPGRPNGYAIALTGDDAKEAKTTLAQLDRMNSAVTEYRALLKKGAKIGANSATAAALHSRLTTMLKDSEKLGALSKDDYKILNDRVPDIASWTSLDSRSAAKLDALDESMRQSKNNVFKIYLPGLRR